MSTLIDFLNDYRRDFGIRSPLAYAAGLISVLVALVLPITTKSSCVGGLHPSIVMACIF